jgi:hypothetical protein
MEWSVGAIWNRDQVVGAKGLTASIAMKLIAAGAEHLAAVGVRARADFEECVAAIFVVLDWKALEKRVASGARGRREGVSHVFILMLINALCQA